MTRLRFTVAVPVLLLLGAPAPADARSDGLKPEINSEVAVARRVAKAVGVDVVDLTSGESVYSFNAEAPRILASNTKLVTAAAALDQLGPGFFFETEVLARGEVADGVLRGDLAIVGGGDPTLSGRHYLGDVFGPFREWAAVLRGLGIRRIEGDLVLVHGLFDDQLVHPDWPKDQLTRWYEAPVAALSYNDNCVLVKVSPDRRLGRAARVEIEPDLPLFHVEASVLTTGQARNQRLRLDRTSFGSDVLSVDGHIYHRTESYDQWLTVGDPVAYFGAALRAAFSEEGIAITGHNLRRAELPHDSRVWRRVTTHRTGLLDVLEVVNKRSQNFYAESVLKRLGAELCGDGSWAGGLRVVREMLAGVGLPEGSYQLADGSGMSRKNRFTPRQITTLLKHMFSHRWGAELIRTLPYSGERGLRWSTRMAKGPYRGNVMAKTGYLRGVSTLSGYAKAGSGKIYAFSFLMNGIATDRQAKAAQDRILRAIIDHG